MRHQVGLDGVHIHRNTSVRCGMGEVSDNEFCNMSRFVFGLESLDECT